MIAKKTSVFVSPAVAGVVALSACGSGSSGGDSSSSSSSASTSSSSSASQGSVTTDNGGTSGDVRFRRWRLAAARAQKIILAAAHRWRMAADPAAALVREPSAGGNMQTGESGTGGHMQTEARQ